MNLDENNRRLLAFIERAVPLEGRPYARIGEAVGLSESDVLAQLAELRQPAGPVRQIGGMFEATALGYSQILAAMAVPADSLDRAGDMAADHPGVSHCYARTGRFNLWFTLAISPESSLGMSRTIEILGRLCEAEKTLLLPSLKRYKLNARFMSAGETGPADKIAPENPYVRNSSPAAGAPRKPSPEQIKSIRLLQADLPNVSNAFEFLAGQADLAETQLLDSAGELLRLGWMRRYCAVLRHRTIGMAANVLVAWRALRDEADRCGEKFSSDQRVSHCYLRPDSPEWPYNLYTMIHGRTRQDCQAAIADLRNMSGLNDFAELWTQKEYRKARVELFSPLEKVWEAQNAGTK